MSDLLAPTLRHLEALVGFDTRNPPRRIGADGIFDYLREQLQGFRIVITDHGAGAVSMLAMRGTPQRLFNVHLDTVPDSPHWSADPLRLRVQDGRVIGLGACDIKGAAAAWLAAAAASQGDAAILLGSDEEANDARCIQAFLAGAHGFAEVIAAEPTGCRAALAHRGLSSVVARFAGTAGHASAAGESAVHRAVRWGVRAIDHAAGLSHLRFGGLNGMPLNLGRIEGGIKANMIAPECELRIGMRPLPSQDLDAVHAELIALAEKNALADYRETFRGPSLPAGDGADAEAARLAARDLADSLGLPVGPAVDFWTEAALFSQAGLTALVFGPGDIAQAHAADEWVALEQLDEAATHYARLLQ